MPVDLRKRDRLTDTEQAILELERSWWKLTDAKETAVRDRFGWSSGHYYRQVSTLIDRPEALTADPLLVRRLRRLRDDRRDERSSRRRHPTARSGR
ncbi:DUF3263 domain-containing protein [Nocardioides plantarum]|uniref:DUF3263 domain-containing protein n=1 Tax=Nocardioides plantarum TaxID=29299 RepID=A0ABV5KGL5_9ACTN|nr:DUF3263 domain-containing protein [Nocardioides plantarum]